MDIRILKREKDTLEFEIVGEDHTFCNLLRELLSRDERVVMAAYRVDHPLVGHPRFVVMTDGSADPKDVLLEKAKLMRDLALEFKEACAKALSGEYEKKR